MWQVHGSAVVVTASGIARFSNIFTNTQPGLYRLRFDVRSPTAYILNNEH